MSLPEKELELIREAVKQLSSSIVRTALLRLTLLALLVFAFANAFRQIGEIDVTEKINDINSLEGLTDESAWKLEAYAVQDFYLLRGWLTDPGESEGGAAEEKLARAREVLSKHLRKERGANDKAPGPEAGAEAGEGQPVGQEPRDADVDPEEKQAAVELQKRLAAEVRKAHGEAFSPEYSIAGAKLKPDLRNWFALLPFLLVTSELYLYILRKERKLLHLLASNLIHANAAARSNIPTLDKLLFADRPGAVAAYARYPSRLSEAIYLVLSLGLLIYLAATAEPIWKGLEGPHFIIMSMPLLTAVFYAVAYALHVSNRLAMQFASEAALTVPPGKLMALWRRVRERGRRIVTRGIPRFWLTTGSGLILVTLYMAVAVDSCGGAKRGHELLFNPTQVTYLGEGESIPGLEDLGENETWWFTALFNFFRTSEPRYQSRATFNLVVLNQHLGRGAYILSLTLAAATIILLPISYSRFSPLKTSWLCGLLYFVSGGTLLFFVTDLYFTFYLPRLKFVLMVACWLTPLTLWASLGFSQKKRARWAKVRPVVAAVIAPLAVLSFLVPTITVFEEEGRLPGLFVLLSGAFALCLGYRQLYKPCHARGGSSRRPAPDGGMPPAAGQ